ncbi:hypothetical protein [Pedobacter ureilyticus]|uniref:N-acetyltransferase domain-containing protein n=1 Tax=Pedobacter ureilyticus TaxID=1393051 RepID=A0ABW9J8B2_9SPHI|nr:hypothetical protein [Pedobacter helvus]
MDKVKLIRELNDGWAHLVELQNGQRIIISWEQDDEDRVDFRFYEDNTEDDENECELENQMDGEFTFKNETADDDLRSKSGYKLIYMFSPKEYLRMGIGTYIIKWFLEMCIDCSHIYASDPFDVTIKDGSEVTGTGGFFLSAMQKLDLIQDAYNED